MEEAGISKLPAPLLHHILSFFSQKEAVKTCVLSKSWRHLGTTRPNFILDEYDFREDKEKFKNVLDESLQVYYDQKLCIEDFSVRTYSVGPRWQVGLKLAPLLEKWIPKVIHGFGVKKLHLSFDESGKGPIIDLPFGVFESKSLQELFLKRCNLSKINYISKHLKTLDLSYVYIEEETFASIMSSCPLIERFSLHDCKGFRTIKIHNHHNLKSFDIYHNYNGDGRIEIYLPSTIGCVIINQCPNWFHHRNYFPGLTCLNLILVPLSNEWFDSFSRNFPCLEELLLNNCDGFDELKLSSPSIKNLYIMMDRTTTTRVTIDAPSIKMFHYDAKISQSISFATTSRSIWKSKIDLSLDLDGSLWFQKLSELATAFSQSQVISLMLSGFSRWNLSDISVCCGSYKMPVAIGSFEMNGLSVHYDDSFFSDPVNGLFRIFRPREIKLLWSGDVHAILEGMSFWQHDLEEVSLQVFERESSWEWHHVATICWKS